MVRLTRWMIVVSVAALLIAGFAAYFALRQADISQDALNLAKETANSSSADTRAALEISDRVARATEDQARITRQALGTSDRIATANERQVVNYSNQLKLAQADNVDLISQPAGLVGGNWTTSFQIVNEAPFAIRRVRLYKFGGWMTDERLKRTTPIKIGEPITVDLTSRNGHNITVTTPADRYAEGSGNRPVQSIVVEYTDNAGKRQSRYRCVVYLPSGGGQMSADYCDDRGRLRRFGAIN